MKSSITSLIDNAVQNWAREIQKWLGRDRLGIFIADAKANLKTVSRLLLCVS